MATAVEEKLRDPSQQQRLDWQQTKPKRSGIATAACTALALFVAFNCALVVFNPDRKKASSANDSLQDLWSGSGSIDLAINGFKALKERPTVVLLGSSLIMHPFWTMDAEKDPKLVDIFHYHGSRTLEQKLAEQGAPNQRVYSLAVFGEMISDAYIYVNEYLKGDKKPDVLMLGIAPRDFSDSDLSAPMATFTFKRVINLENFSKYADAYLPGWQDKADWLATHGCYIYGKRWRLQHEVGKVVDKTYNSLGLAPEDTAAPPTQSAAGFLSAGSTEQRWSNSVKEYRRRYHDIADRDLSIQEGFLNRLLNVCAERGIKVVLVNMPLSARNRELLPAQFYAGFRQKIAEIAKRPGVKFVDMGSAPEFNEQDYWDTAHLNHHGGHKLVDRVTPYLVQDLHPTP